MAHFQVERIRQQPATAVAAIAAGFVRRTILRLMVLYHF
jgi:hypothetical protein